MAAAPDVALGNPATMRIANRTLRGFDRRRLAGWCLIWSLCAAGTLILINASTTRLLLGIGVVETQGALHFAVVSTRPKTARQSLTADVQCGYTFEVGGKTYTGSRLWPVNLGMSQRNADALVREMNRQTSCQVRYLASDPNVNAIDVPPIRVYLLLFMAWLAVSTAIGLLLAAPCWIVDSLIRRKRNGMGADLEGPAQRRIDCET